MKILDTIGVIEELCKTKKCYGLYFDFKCAEDTFYNTNDVDSDQKKSFKTFDMFYAEIRKAIPIMFTKCEEKHLRDEFTQAFVDNEGWILFEHYYMADQETVMWFNYDQISGGEPTRLNDYDGPLEVYAICFGPDGPIKDNS